MPRVNAGVIGQGEQLFADGAKEHRTIRSRQVPSPDAAREKGIPREKIPSGEVDDMPRCVAGYMAHLDLEGTEMQDLAVAHRAVRRSGIERNPDLSREVQPRIGEHRRVEGMADHRRIGVPLPQGFDGADVVAVPVGDQDRGEGEVAVAEKRVEPAGFIARVDDHRRPRLLEEEGVGRDHADCQTMDLHPHLSPMPGRLIAV